MKSLLLFLLCVHVNAPSLFDLFGFGHKTATKYEHLLDGKIKHDFDYVARSEEADKISKIIRPGLLPFTHEQETKLQTFSKIQSSDETLEFVRYELYNINCKINVRQYYTIIFNFNSHFINKKDLVRINELKTLTGWILNEYENIGKLSRFLKINAHILRRFALDILTFRINCGSEDSFKLLCSYMYCSSYSVVKKILTFQDSSVEDEPQDSSPQDLKSKISEICNRLAKGVVWKKQPHIDVEEFRRKCCSEQNLSDKSKEFWNNVIVNSQWVKCKEFENLPTCIRLILTDEAGEADKLKRLEEFAGCTFKADERLPLNFSEKCSSVFSQEEE